MKKKSVILFMAMFSIILINLFLIIATNPFEDIFSSRFDLGITGFIISLIPAVILLIITYISFKKASRALMSIQLLLWWIFTFYVCLRAFAFLDYSLNLGFYPITARDFFMTYNVPSDESQYYWFQISIFANAALGLIMSFGNDALRKLLVRKR